MTFFHVMCTQFVISHNFVIHFPMWYLTRFIYFPIWFFMWFIFTCDSSTWFMWFVYFYVIFFYTQLIYFHFLFSFLWDMQFFISHTIHTLSHDVNSRVISERNVEMHFHTFFTCNHILIMCELYVISFLSVTFCKERWCSASLIYRCPAPVHHNSYFQKKIPFFLEIFRPVKTEAPYLLDVTAVLL